MKFKDLHKDVHTTFDILTEYLPKGIDWFIAGGSLTSQNFEDIDIYFVTEEDYERCLKFLKASKKESALPPGLFFAYSTSNADNFALQVNNEFTRDQRYIKLDQRYIKLQFIKLYVGCSEEVMEKFDINKSKIALDKHKNFYYGKNYSEPLSIDYNNVKTNTFDRLIKYVIDKGYLCDKYTIDNAIEYLITDADQLLAPSYKDQKSKKKFYVLTGFLDSLFYYDMISKEKYESTHNSMKNLYPEQYI